MFLQLHNNRNDIEAQTEQIVTESSQLPSSLHSTITVSSSFQSITLIFFGSNNNHMCQSLAQVCRVYDSPKHCDYCWLESNSAEVIFNHIKSNISCFLCDSVSNNQEGLVTQWNVKTAAVSASLMIVNKKVTDP